MTDRVEKTIDLRAPVERVWRALVDSQEFGTWFGSVMDGPFALGENARGRVTYKGYEHLTWDATVVAMELPRRFAFTWRPYAVDPAVDYSAESPTLVEFLLEPIGEGTRLTVIESGFENVPEHRRDEAWRMNDRGWTEQVENLRAHVDG